MATMAGLQALRAFRVDLHGCFGRRADAQFELADALLASAAVPSLPHLSLHAAHRRGWGSTYAALASGEVDAEGLRGALAARPLTDGQPIFAVDVSAWPRCDAEASPERGYYYHPSRHSAGRPIVAGWAHQWPAQLSFARDSWTAPLDVRRVHPAEDAAVAIEQIRTPVDRLGGGVVPLFVFDAGYTSVQLTRGLADLPVAVPVRLRAGRCFYADPPVAAPSPLGGRPRKHGAKLDCGAPATWPTPTAERAAADERYGDVRVRAWVGLHPTQQAHATRGTRRARPIVRGTVILVEVSRLPAAPTSRGYTQLRLARAWVADRRLPRERPLDPANLTPPRVGRALSA